MALIREGLWDIVANTETCPDQTREADKYKKYVARRDRALATIVLSIDVSLLYLLEDPQDPAKVWQELSNQFQKQTWANKGKKGALNVVTERLLREEEKLKGKQASEREPKALVTGGTNPRTSGNPRAGSKPFNCHYCGKPGHFKRDCRKWAKRRSEGGGYKRLSKQCSGNQDAMLIGQALAAKSGSEWLVDSGATSHMVNERRLLTEVQYFDPGESVTLGDGNRLEVKSVGTVDVEMSLTNGSTRKCSLQEVLYVPKLSYSLISVARATEMGKTVTFSNVGCKFLDDQDQHGTLPFENKQEVSGSPECSPK